MTHSAQSRHLKLKAMERLFTSNAPTTSTSARSLDTLQKGLTRCQHPQNSQRTPEMFSRSLSTSAITIRRPPGTCGVNKNAQSRIGTSTGLFFLLFWAVAESLFFAGGRTRVRGKEERKGQDDDGEWRCLAMTTFPIHYCVC